MREGQENPNEKELNNKPKSAGRFAAAAFGTFAAVGMGAHYLHESQNRPPEGSQGKYEAKKVGSPEHFKGRMANFAFETYLSDIKKGLAEGASDFEKEQMHLQVDGVNTVSREFHSQIEFDETLSRAEKMVFQTMVTEDFDKRITDRLTEEEKAKLIEMGSPLTLATH